MYVSYIKDDEAHREVMEELFKPICSEGLDHTILRRLYESKLIYLENLRIKSFQEINLEKNSRFSLKDYELILLAIKKTKHRIKDLILLAC